MEATIFLFSSFFILLFLAIPIGYAIGVATLLTMMNFSNIPLIMISQNAVSGIDSFPLMAIPFFIFAGNIMSTGGVAKRLIEFFNLLLRKRTGALGMVTIVACMFFAAISGSAMATTAAIGGFMIPEMEKRGYSKAYSASLAAAAGTIGVIIPPSIPFVLYGVVTGNSISDLFIAGMIPGILMGLALMTVNYVVSKKNGNLGDKNAPSLSLKEFLKAFNDAIWAILTPVIILGGIYGGVFTPTEAAVVACVYATIVSVVIYKELTFKQLYKTLFTSMEVNGTTVFMVGLSTVFATFLTMEQIPAMLAEAILNLTSNKIIVLLLINILLLVVGCFIDNIPATIILAPILLPVVRQLGMSATQFGVMLTLNLAIGFVTPPYGINLFVAQAVAGVKMEQMVKYIKWLILALFIVLVLTTYFEPTTMFLVKLFKG
ncbi:TRAP transporter, DctM subunit [Clostridium aceticum]|uniref:TRAP transporter, DctM subunit n=1 Tax=Clostridium aceticum TaxID=84022 RepID=A0A0D8I8Y3_9CLOT|nr:TRAP transporter large permease [Clostridium aceticum]AKL94586.1 TRAP transporter, DctM subunit [Clostridium aceticum]KJF26504.1 C4-dicarboxylate ABC transporter permease [Clostridium aceticum]